MNLKKYHLDLIVGMMGWVFFIWGLFAENLWALFIGVFNLIMAIILSYMEVEK